MRSSKGSMMSKNKKNNTPQILTWVSVAISALAVLVGGVALSVTLLAKPLGEGVGGYDFSTPEAAAKSYMQIELNADIQAEMDIRRIKNRDGLKGMIDTFEVGSVESFGGKKLVFVSYMLEGEKIKEVLGFEKSIKSGGWMEKSFYEDEEEIKKTNTKLAKKIQDWRKVSSK